MITALTMATAGAALPPTNSGAATAATADAPQPRRPATTLGGFLYYQGRVGRGVYRPLREVPGAAITAHLLLLLVAAPLLALSAPSSAILRGSPLGVRRASGRWRRRLGLTHGNLGVLRHPAAVWLLSVGVLWFWHAAAPYDAALDSEPLHLLEHASFLVTAVLFWHVVVGVRGVARVSNGLGVLLVFTMAMQSVFLSVLLTFARTPWYSGYATTTAPWGLDPLTDQQLAGVLMWIPAGGIYLAVALALLVSWIRATEVDDVAVEEAGRQGSSG